MRGQKRLYTVGVFWLEAPKGRYKTYAIKWFNRLTRQTDGFRIGTTDFEVAKKEIHEHELKHRGGQKLKDEPVPNSMSRYYLLVASKQPSEPSFAIAMKNVVSILGSPMVSEMGPANQMKLIEALRAKEYADATILRTLSCVWRSMHYGERFEHLSEGVIPKQLSSKDWNKQKGKTKRLLSSQEMGQLLDAACSIQHRHRKPQLCEPRHGSSQYTVRWMEGSVQRRTPLDTSDPVEAAKRYDRFVLQFRSQHPDTWRIEYGRDWRCLVSLIGSGARSRAIADVCIQQIEKIDSEYSVLHLNPHGRIQTKKHRPTIPIAPTFGKWLASWEPLTPEGHLIGGKRCRKNLVSNIFRRLSGRVGFEVTPHMIRHFVATWLASSKRISGAWERDMFMGWQRSEGSAMGSVYNHYNPGYLRGAALAIEDLFKELASYTFADLMLKGFHDQPSPENVWEDAPSLPTVTLPGGAILLPARSSALVQIAAEK